MKDIAREFQAVANLAEVGTRGAISEVGYRRFGLGPKSITYRGPDNLKRFDALVDLLLESDRNIGATVSRQAMEKRVVELISETRLSNVGIDAAQVKGLYAKLAALPCATGHVFRSLHGATFASASPLVLGPYVIYDWTRHQDIIRKLAPKHSEAVKLFEHGSPKSTLVSVEVAARDPERAIELADSKFRQFENTVRFMIGSLSGTYDVGVFNYRQWTTREVILLGPTMFMASGDAEGATQSVEIDGPYFLDPQRGHDKLWAMLAQPSPGELAKRILSAIDWAGKAIRDTDKADAFVQAVFALEALLLFRESGVFVTPSVAHQLSETAAFLISSDRAKRRMVASRVGELYKLRSALVHGGSASVKVKDIVDCLSIVKTIILQMNTNAELLGMSSMKQVWEWVQDKKYT
jgi:hypothetical protein